MARQKLAVSRVIRLSHSITQKPEGEITEIKGYQFPKPGTTEPTFQKVSFVTKIGELTCGVGYYK